MDVNDYDPLKDPGKLRRVDEPVWQAKISVSIPDSRFAGFPSLENTCYFNSLCVLLGKAGVTSRIATFQRCLTDYYNGIAPDVTTWWSL